MFRRLSHSLPKDAVFPADLNQLGYHINDKDQIRKLDKPEEKYQFRINRSDRVNEICATAANTHVREIVLKRLRRLGMETIRLPLGSHENEPHVPILVSKSLEEKKRVILLLGERHQDLGILSGRVLFDEGINMGSAVNIVAGVLKDNKKPQQDIPGVIIANPGQLLWYRDGNRSVSQNEWLNLPRESAVHEAFRIDDLKNKIPQNGDYLEHVTYILDHVLNEIINTNAIVDIIGLEYTGTVMIQHIARDWSHWSTRIGGICLGAPQHQMQDLLIDENASQSFLHFLLSGCRAYFVSPSPLGATLPGVEKLGCYCFASGEELYEENILVRSWPHMIDFLNQIHDNLS